MRERSGTAAKRVAIVGAGALGQQIAQHLNQTAGWQATGFFDDFAVAGTATGQGRVLGKVADAEAAYANGQVDGLLMGIGYNHLTARQQIFERLVAKVPFVTFVHPSAHVDASAVVAAGCFVSPACVLDLNAVLGPNSFLYSGCVVSHDTHLLGHSFLAPAVRLAGCVVIETGCFLGIGTTVADNLRVGPNVRTGAGTTVVRSLELPGTYVGTPARRLG